jgi:hypothetical protein
MVILGGDLPRRWSPLLVIVAWGCGGSAIPDPKAAADAYALAAAKGDGDAIYAMMTTSARQQRSRDEVRKIVSDERSELAFEARNIQSRDARIEANARLRFDDGEETALEYREGRFWVTSAGTLPGGARSPEGALDQLRRVLARRNYPGLVRVLSPSTRAAIERDLRSLIEGLDHPEALPIQVSGDHAAIEVPGGHHVRLRREAGVWHVEDFD